MPNPNEPLATASLICLALMRLGTRMSARFDVRFTPHHLTQAQFRVLLGVWQIGEGSGVTPSVLAEYLFIERPTATVLVAKLVERDLLARIPDPHDRRSHTLCLTKSGGELLASAGDAATRLGEQTIAPFSEAEQETFLQLLTRLEAHLRHSEGQITSLPGDNDG